VRSKVRKRRVLFQNAFADFDRMGEGHVTRNQFARVMATLKLLEHDEKTIDLLCMRYCDKGNPMYFNYREFSRNCDPPDEDLTLAEQQNLAPYEKPVSSKYFDMRGNVFDHHAATKTMKPGA